MRVIDIAATVDDYETTGWFKFPVSDGARLEGIRAGILDKLRDKIPALDAIENYHQFVEDDAEHFAIQKYVSDWYWGSGLGPELLAQDVAVFRKFMGLDLHIQERPYLRIVRPDKQQDNVAYHRDTHYGGSPYEVSVHIPFTDTGPEGSLCVITGSHVEPDSAYPYDMIENPGVARGSVMHQLGFLYAPKRMRPEHLDKLASTDTRLGEALVFSLSTVHGQVLNASAVTRFSTDIRMVNSLAPVDWVRLAEKGYYKPLSQSAATTAAKRYEAAEAASKAAQTKKAG